MAIGQRLVADLMAEVAFHLLEPITVQTILSPVAAGPAVTVTLAPPSPPALPSSPLTATYALYPGALVIVGWQSGTGNAEVVSVIQVLSGTTFTANLLNAHAAGETVFGATFPTQQPTDPVFTQSEILGYIAQAQNEFLTKVPLIFQFFSNLEVLIGQTYQTLPATTIELERVAVQSNPPSTTFPVATITRVGNLVTAILSSPSLPDQWTPLLPVQVYGVTDPSFNTASNSTVLLQTISPDGLTVTWNQTAADATSTGGFVSRPVLTRLYESAQEQIGLNQPWWAGQQGSPPTNWWEDRAGIYGYGLAPPPAGNFWMELLCSVRADEDLNLLSGFMVPDVFVYAMKWRVLSYCWGKNGVRRSPTMERFAKGKFDFYCMLADRFLRNVLEKNGQA